MFFFSYENDKGNTNINTVRFLFFVFIKEFKNQLIKENIQFVQSKTFGLWEKMIAQLEKIVPQIANEHTCDYFRYVPLLI